MRVEVFEHTDNGILYQLSFVYRINVKAADSKFCHLQLTQGAFVQFLTYGLGRIQDSEQKE